MKKYINEYAKNTLKPVLLAYRDIDKQEYENLKFN